jgi:hypothetical protein
MGHVAKFGWIVLQHPSYSPELVPSDFHLFGPMKDGLRGQHFPDNNAVIAAVRKWVASAGADSYEHSMQALVHRWRKCIANGGDYGEGQCFVADNLLYPTAILYNQYLL